jgi:tRNA A37 threonylcarbamoyladenosine biosynthesis protein TsaE
MQKIVDQSQMQELAAEIAAKAKAGDIFGLKGNLGAGKSFFAGHFINAL